MISSQTVETALELLVVVGLPLSFFYLGVMIRKDMKERREARQTCDHPTLAFSSGDLYVTCRDCNRKWILCEYGDGANVPPDDGTPADPQK